MPIPEPTFACCFFEPVPHTDRRARDFGYKARRARDGKPSPARNERVRDLGHWIPGRRPVAQVGLTWAALCQGLTRFRQAECKSKAPGWMPVTLSRPHRCGDAVLSVSCLVLDIDDGTDPLVVSERWRDWPHIWHSSWSSSLAHPKARLVVPLAEPCPVEVFPRLWRHAQERTGGAGDEQAKDASRYFFLPAVGPAGDCRAEVVDTGGGHWYDPRPWESLPETPEEIALREAAQEAARLKEDMLRRREAGDVAALDRMRADLLKVDPGERAALGVALGGRVTGSKVKGVVCPGCGRPSVWWPLSPHGYPGAMCEHQGSCGFRVWLDELERGGR